MALPRVSFKELLESMRPTLILTTGRTIGFAAAFAIPIVLVRCLDPSQFGTYRLLFLIYTSVSVLVQLGMAESLYYFVPQQPERAASSVANAIASLGLIGLVAGPLLASLAGPIGRWFGADLVVELPKLGLFLAIMLIPTAFEIVLVSRKQHSTAALAYAGSDIVRTALLTVPAAIFRSVDALMTGAVAFALLRLLVFVRYLRSEFGSALRIDRALWTEQLRYALPFAAAVSVEIAQANFHQYAIASRFDPATFAIYSIGCLQVPLVDLLAMSATSVMMVSMTERVVRGESPLPLWHQTIERLAFVFVPLVVALILVAHDLIVTLYTPRYAASAPIFAISTGLILLAAVPVDAVLRVYAQTRFLLVLNVFRLALIAASIGWFMSAWQMTGAILATLVVAVTAKVAALLRVKRLMNASVRDLLPWRALAGTAAAALIAAVPALWIKARLGGGLPLIAATSVTYGLCYLLCMSLGWTTGFGARATAEATRAV